MPKVSAVPGSPQSSTSTVKGSVAVPVGRITEAVPPNVACALPGVAGQEVPGLLMRSIKLTKREVEVLQLITDGLSQVEIARRLFVSPKTVGAHTERIFKKLGAHNRAQAVSLSYQHGLLELATERASAV